MKDTVWFILILVWAIVTFVAFVVGCVLVGQNAANAGRDRTNPNGYLRGSCQWYERNAPYTSSTCTYCGNNCKNSICNNANVMECVCTPNGGGQSSCLAFPAEALDGPIAATVIGVLLIIAALASAIYFLYYFAKNTKHRDRFKSVVGSVKASAKADLANGENASPKEEKKGEASSSSSDDKK